MIMLLSFPYSSFVLPGIILGVELIVSGVSLIFMAGAKPAEPHVREERRAA
jgi:hypothetical protein